MTWQPLWGIVLAVALSLVIGLEREFYAKAAGMRTHTLVGMGSALYTVVSKYGFLDTVAGDWSRFDGSRVAAQVVTGIGFVGAGLIFVRRDAVRGLTTAAGVWFVAAVGMAAGAGLHLVAVAVTLLYVVVMIGIKPISHRMPHARTTICSLTIRYLDGRGVLRDVMEAISREGLKVADLQVLHPVEDNGRRLQEVRIEAEGSPASISQMNAGLKEVPGVESVTTARTTRSARAAAED